jgi:hypothetical protein
MYEKIPIDILSSRIVKEVNLDERDRTSSIFSSKSKM